MLITAESGCDSVLIVTWAPLLLPVVPSYLFSVPSRPAQCVFRRPEVLLTAKFFVCLVVYDRDIDYNSLFSS